MKKIRELQNNRNTIVTFFLILVIVVGSAWSMLEVNDIAEKYCWDTMHQSVRELNDAVHAQMQSDEQLLELMAELLSPHERNEESEIQHILEGYRADHSLVESYEILFPDNMVLTSDGTWIDANGVLSFEEEAAHGIHVSDRVSDLRDSDKMILRHFVPIVREDGIAAMLYGVLDLATLPQKWNVSVFEGEASFYIIDGKNGDFIVDTWNNTLGNVSEMTGRKLRLGYDGNAVQKELLAGQTGHVVFESRITGEYQYFYFEPIDVRDWIIAISVPESVAFKEADSIRNIMITFASFQGICFVGYFIWMLYYAKKESYEKQKRLEMVNYIYDVEKTLFGAHHNEKGIILALKRVAEMTMARIAFFKILEEDGKDLVYLWCNENEEEEKCYEFLEKYRILADVPGERPKSIILADIEQWKIRKPELYQAFKPAGLYNLMEIPVCDENDKLVGVLGVLNMKHRWETTELLDNVSLSFAMIYTNIRLFARIKVMGESDYLTGLLNRNSYEDKLVEYAVKPQRMIACIYGDANGLHEMNNTYGHEKGDEMLKKIAAVFRDAFGTEDTYRIGGDEFLAFTHEKTEEAVVALTEQVKKRIIDAGYHTSVGVCWKAEVSGRASLTALVKDAESQMYADKRRYYENSGIDRRKR